MPPVRLLPHSPIVAAALGIALACASLPAAADEPPARSLADHATTAVRVAASSAWDAARTLTSAALDLIGIRYRWGGATPATGLDCSGLVQFVFQQVTGVTLPRSAKEMSRLGDKIALADLQPGDLVFFNTRRFAFSHVGIYLGDNRFIHAPRRGREVEVATIDNKLLAAALQRRAAADRRVAGDDAARSCPTRPRRCRHPRRPPTRRRSSPTRPDRGPAQALRAGRALQPRDHGRVVAALRPVERARAVLVAAVRRRRRARSAARRSTYAPRAPPSSAPSCRSATPR